MNPECINCCNRETVDVQHEVIEHLTYYIERIAEVIYYQMPLKEQDMWLRDIIEEGIYKPILDEE